MYAMEAERFLEEVYGMRDDPEPRDGIQFIFGSLNNLLLTGDVGSCDGILLRADVSRMNVDQAVSFLTITLNASYMLPSRRGYYRRARRMIAGKLGLCEARALLKGLK